MGKRFEERFIMAGGCALRVGDTGEGDRAILLLHGYLESLDAWDDFVPLLTHGARIIGIDLPGHGISEVKGEEHTMAFMADVAHAVLQKLGVEKALIVGHSMGGYVALEFIARHPEAATGIVLLHSMTNADSEKKADDRRREIELIKAGRKELIARSFPHIGFAPQNRERLADEIEDRIEQTIITDDDGIIAALNGMRTRADNNEMLRHSTVPQLAIIGRYDEYITPDVSQAMLDVQPQMEAAWLENSGHMGYIEEPGKCAEIILGFLDKINP